VNFTWLDAVVIVLIAFSVAMSVMKGFVREVMGIVAVLAAILIAGWTYRPASNLFKDVVRTENLALFFGFSIVFVGTLLAGFLVIWLITKFTKFARLQWFDRLLGAAFGFVRGWALGAVVFLGLTAFDIQTDRVRSSLLAPYMLPGARVIAVITPYEMKARFLVGYRAVERWWLEQG
jgi:membrane protein required for colicin V production